LFSGVLLYTYMKMSQQKLLFIKRNGL
jgi:hypothetical protein